VNCRKAAREGGLGRSFSIISFSALFESRKTCSSLAKKFFAKLQKGNGNPFPFLYTNTTCTSSIYSAVPPAMDSSTLLRHRCSRATTAMEISSGAP